MHALEHAVLGVFKESPEATNSTTELVQSLLPHEWSAVQEQLRSMDPAVVRRGKTAKARLHRKLLYHVNKLVEDGLLRVHAVQGRGEKRFALAVTDVEIRSGHQRIRIHKPTKITTPIDDEQHIVAFDREHWLERVNAVLLEGLRYDSLAGLSDFLARVAPFVNDVIGVVRAETLLGGTIAEYEAFLDRAQRLSCGVSLLMSVSKLGEGARLLRFCRVVAERTPKNVTVVFNVTPQSLQERREVLTSIVEVFAKHDIKVNMKNSGTHTQPVMCGKAGPYAMSKEDWDAYQSVREDAVGVVMCGASVVVNTPSFDQPHDAARKAAEALFLVGRTRSLASLHDLGVVTGFTADVVRWWNYDLDDELLPAELAAANDVVKDFCTLQERVYRACGLPIHCRVVTSSAFGTFPGVSPRAYKKRSVQDLSALQDEYFSEYLLLRESLARLFCADRVRFFRSGAVDAVAIIREFGFVLNTYALPFVTYDFRGLQGNVQLTEFFGGAS